MGIDCLVVVRGHPGYIPGFPRWVRVMWLGHIALSDRKVDHNHPFQVMIFISRTCILQLVSINSDDSCILLVLILIVLKLAF